jgi:hypothetical protein
MEESEETAPAGTGSATSRLEPSDVEKLLGVRKTLNLLTISLHRIGTYWAFYGEEAGKEQLVRFMGPAVYRRIALARRELDEVLVASDPVLAERLEQRGGHWDGPGWMPPSGPDWPEDDDPDAE